jgi:hypothetical protein
LSELRRADEVYRTAEIGEIEDVEEIRTLLKGKPLGEVEPPPQRGIELDCIAPAESMASQVSLA